MRFAYSLPLPLSFGTFQFLCCAHRVSPQTPRFSSWVPPLLARGGLSVGSDWPQRPCWDCPASETPCCWALCPPLNTRRNTDFMHCRGVATGVYGYIIYIPPKSVQVDFYVVKMTSKRLLNMSIKFYTSPKNFIPPKQISGYAPDALQRRGTGGSGFTQRGLKLNVDFFSEQKL